jgi:cell division control protein 6
LNSWSVPFPPYDAHEFEDILESRGDVATVDDAVEEGVLNRCAVFTTCDGGSTCRAPDLL